MSITQIRQRLVCGILLAGLVSLPLVVGAAVADETGTSALASAVKAGDRSAVQSLLDSHANVDVPDADGTTALMWAAYGSDVETLDLLLRAGADVKAANEYGTTALYAAAVGTDAAMTEKLLAAGADPNARLMSGETPLMQAARRGNLAIVRLLLAGGADPNAQEANAGQNALIWAISEHHAEVAAELVRHGADVNERSKNGFTAISFAAQQGDTDSIRTLLEAGANVNDVAPKSGLTPLIIATAMGRAKAVTLLLDKGANPNVAAANGYTPLHLAAKRKGAVAIVSALLAHKADPNVRLVAKKPIETVNGIVLNGATPLALACDINNFDVVKALVDGGADLLIPTDEKTTPVMMAAGAAIYATRPRPPEERATAIKTVTFLVEHGAYVNGAGQFGWTAVHSAAYMGMNDVIEYLAGKGANLDAKDEFGQTPLSIANTTLTKEVSTHGYQAPRVLHRDTVNLLLKLGATPLEKSGVVAYVQRATD
ncbi:MAG TPA: ankyrin repeat domain-containing protein [Xanthobacteraceae bacterium]|jgi:ankyrin repeat protein